MTRREIIEAVDARFRACFEYVPDRSINGGLAEEWRPVEDILREWRKTGRIRDDCDVCRVAGHWLVEAGVPEAEQHLIFAKPSVYHLLLTVECDGDHVTCCDTLGGPEQLLGRYRKHELLKTRRMDQTIRDWVEIEWE